MSLPAGDVAAALHHCIRCLWLLLPLLLLCDHHAAHGAQTAGTRRTAERPVSERWLLHRPICRIECFRRQQEGQHGGGAAASGWWFLLDWQRLQLTRGAVAVDPSRRTATSNLAVRPRDGKPRSRVNCEHHDTRRTKCIYHHGKKPRGTLTVCGSPPAPKKKNVTYSGTERCCWPGPSGGHL